MATKTFPSLTHTDREGFPSLTLTEEKDLFFILEIWSHQKANFFSVHHLDLSKRNAFS